MSLSARMVRSPRGRVKAPRASGDHGIEPTPKSWGKREGLRRGCAEGRGLPYGRMFAYLERGHHLALFLAVDQIVMVLHRDKGRQAIVDGVICQGIIFFKRKKEGLNQLLPFSTADICHDVAETIPTLHLMDWSKEKEDV
jgi:hypothetical protein